MIDICIPVCRNLTCLRMAALGLQTFGGDCQVLLHVQEPDEEALSVEAFQNLGIGAEVVSRASKGSDIANYMDILFSNATSEWVVFMEQDTFLFQPLEGIVEEMRQKGYAAAGPMDTFFYDHPNARDSSKYGEYARLSPMPGYFHSSLVVVQRSAVPPNPFRVPDDFKFHGWGCLGAEPYYGLRLHFEGKNRKLMFFRQKHGAFGLAADIVLPSGRLLATHLYYSGTKDDYFNEGFLGQQELDWLKNEETRFLRYYREGLKDA